MNPIIKSLRLVSFFMILCVLQSCYSVRMVTTLGVPEPDIMNNVDGFYRHKKVDTIKKTVSLKVLEKDFTLLEKCGSDGFHSIEYRNTFGGLLLSTISFGKKRRVLIKYVCIKESN